MQLSSHIRVSEGRPNSSRTLKCIRTRCHDVRKDVRWSTYMDTNGHPDGIVTSSGWMLLTNERSDDTLGHLDGNKGSGFCWVGICTEASWNAEITFFRLVTLILIILRPFLYQRNKLWIYEDSKIYGIPVKAARLHDIDFVNRMQPIKN